MLEDITKLTKRVFYEALDFSKDLHSPKAVYDTYRSLHVVIEAASLVANHYLALKFDEEYLQDSSIGEPVDKWRYVLNKDLETLNDATKKYLHSLSSIAFENLYENILSKYFRPLHYYGFVRDEYTVGYIEPCSSTCIVVSLDIKSDNLDAIESFKKIELKSYQQRVDLKESLLREKSLLQIEIEKLKEYIVKKYKLKDLL